MSTAGLFLPTRSLLLFPLFLCVDQSRTRHKQKHTHANKPHHTTQKHEHTLKHDELHTTNTASLTKNTAVLRLRGLDLGPQVLAVRGHLGRGLARQAPVLLRRAAHIVGGPRG